MKDKVVIITGASSGIGKACAEKFAKEGCKLVLAARNLSALSQLKDEFDSQKFKSIIVQTDVSKETECINLIETTISNFGRIDILINNAGISMRAALSETDPSVIQKVMDVNFFGTVYCTRYALPHIQKSKGSIIGVSSIAGYKGLPGRTGYSASKFAMQGFLESVRIENLKRGVHVMVICPGFTSSNIRQTALSKDGSVQGESPRDEKSMMTPEEVAIHLFKGILKKKRTVILTFSGKLTVFLSKFFPKLSDKLVYNHLKKEPDAPF